MRNLHQSEVEFSDGFRWMGLGLNRRCNMILSTLCYIENDGKYLMLLRNKKSSDVNEGKWIGVGGKFEPGESPEECVCREVLEETGLKLLDYKLRGVLTFSSVGWEDEYIFVYTADCFEGCLGECDEGELRWIEFDEIPTLNLWEGDRIFLNILLEKKSFFSLKLAYDGDRLKHSEVKIYE